MVIYSIILLLLAHVSDTVIAGNDIPNPQRGVIRIVVISDLNSAYGSTEYEPEVSHTVQTIANHWKPDLVLCAGDMIAGQRPALTDDTVREMWEAFHSVVLQPLQEAEIPFAFTLGNHDASAHPGHERDRTFAENFWTSDDAWTGIDIAENSRYPFYYSFSRHNLYFVSLYASSAGIPDDTSQVHWLENTLQSKEAQKAGLRIVFGHLPLYAIAEGRNRPGEVLDSPDSLLTVFAKHNVDMYISGHHHAFYPGQREGIHLLHAGVLGQGARSLIGTDMEPYQSVVIIDIDEDDEVSYTAYRIDTDTEPVYTLIDPDTLPEIIEGFHGYVRRLN